MDKGHTLFLEQGIRAVDELHRIEARLNALKEQSSDFPMTESEVSRFQEKIAAQVLTIHDLKLDATTTLRDVMT